MNRFISTSWQMTLMALQYMRGRKLRTVLTTAAIVFGVALIFGFNITLPGAMEAFKRSLTAASGAVDLTVTGISGEAFDPEEPLQKAAAVPGVRAVTGVLRRQVSLPQIPAGGEGLVGKAPQLELTGIDPTTAIAVRDYPISAGRFLEAGDTGKAVLPAGIGELAPQLKVGSTFPLITSGGLRLYEIVGFTAEAGNPSAPQVLVTLADAQSALNQPGLINAIDIAFRAGEDSGAVTNAVLQALGANFIAGSGSGGLDAVASMQIAFVMFNTLGLLALFMGAFLIFNTFRTVVIERRRDLGMLRAIGATRTQVTQMILIQSLIQGVIGTLIGLVMGYLFARLIVAGMNSIIGSYMTVQVDVSVSMSAVLSAAVPGLVIAVLAGYLPARAAGRVTPIEALRPAAVASTQQAAQRMFIAGIGVMLIAIAMLLKGDGKSAAGGAIIFLTGMAVAAPGLVIPAARLFSPLLVLWYAREGDIARGNLMRQPGRAAITASTLMIGLATLILVASIVTGMDGLVRNLVDRGFTSDLMLMPPSLGLYGSVVGADDSLTNRLHEIPSVETVAGLRYATSSINSKSVQVLGIDPVNYPKVAQLDFSSGTPDEAFPAMQSGRSVILNGIAAATLGANGAPLNVGDDVVLPTAEGEQTYRVVGIANDLLSFKVVSAFISQANLAADFHKAEDVLMMINLKPGRDKQAALTEVQAILKDYPQFNAVITGEYRGQMLNLVAGSLNLFYALAILILIPAALGLLNTLTINVLERTREIGVVRAVGGSRKQVRRMITAESLLLGLFGAATGILAGAAMSYGFTAVFGLVGWKMPYQVPVMGMIAALVIAVLLALFASILPARNAARLHIIRALQYE